MKEVAMNNILRNLMLSTLLPLIILSGVSGGYLYQIVLSDKLSEINRFNDIYKEILIEKSANALATSDYPYFQKAIDSLIEKENSGIISIELISIIDNKEIVASAPAAVPYSSPAVKIDIYGVKFTDDSFNVDHTEKDNIGYLLIRYNDNYIKQATHHIIFYFVALIIITILLMIAVYKNINKIVIDPYNEIKRNLIILKNNDSDVAELNNYSENEINHLIRDVLDIQKNNFKLIELMKRKIHRLKNETNEAKFTQYEMIGELVHVLERKAGLAHRLIAKMLDENKNNNMEDSYYLLSGTVNEITKSLNDSKKLINNPYANYSPNAISIEKLYENLMNSTIERNYTLYTTKNIKNKLLAAYVFTDNTQVQLLIDKFISIASQVSVRNELYLNLLIEEISEDKLRISIEIKDSSCGMSTEEAENINSYINGDQKEINTMYYRQEDIKIIKYLRCIPDLIVNIYPDSGRGNYYRVSLECDYSYDVKQLCTASNGMNINVVKVQEDPESDLLIEHYKMMGIDISYVQFCQLAQKLEYVVNQDIIVFDFSTNFDESMKVYNHLNQHKCKIIATVNKSQVDISDKNYISDKLFDKGIKDTLIFPYSPERLKETIEKITNFDEIKNHDFMANFIKNFSTDEK